MKILFIAPLLMAGLAVVWIGSGCRGPKVELKHQVAVESSVTNETFRDSLAGQIRTEFLPGNRITALLNGDRIVPAMLGAIRSATKTVNLETYLWQSGKMSDQFIEALNERARAGVEVRVIADAIGSGKLKKEDEDKMHSAGVRFVRYNKPRPYTLNRANYRDHRKLMIVDGKVAFTGGACVGDAWFGNAERTNQWRDTHFQVEGPAVAQIQGIFGANWLKSQGEMLFGEKFYPELPPQGNTLAQNFASGRQDGGEIARLVYLSAIAAAQKKIRLEHAYFLPDDLALQAILQALKRGVEVELVTPGNIDTKVVHRASRTLWPELLRAGMKIYEYGPAMLHCKILIVDDYFVSCGSVNFDPRSFRITDESNINVIDPEFAGRLAADFERDKAQSKLVRLEDLKKTPWYKKSLEWFTSLFRAQL